MQAESQDGASLIFTAHEGEAGAGERYGCRGGKVEKEGRRGKEMNPGGEEDGKTEVCCGSL